MGPDRVLADADHFYVAGPECIDFITEIAGFARSARRIVFGIKIENERATREITERHGFTRIRLE